MTLPPKRQSSLSPERRKLFALLLEEEGITKAPQQPILPRADSTNLPLSFAQQRLWFVHQLDPDSSAYNIPIAVRLSGMLDEAALRHSFNALIQRHESLRTIFPSVDGQPIQVPLPEYASQLTVLDLRERPPAEREVEAQRLTDQSAQQPFDLSQAPPLRALLLRLGDTEHLLLLTIHHIISDGWSLGILVQELAALYQASATGAACALPDLPIQYADYALWQQRESNLLEKQLAYWRSQLAGAPPLLTLPLDRPRPTIQTLQGAYQSFTLPRPLSEALDTLSRQTGATLFMMLLAAFQVLLYRYSDQTDIVVSTGIANRTRPETEPLIGCLTNMLLLRTNLAGNPSFHDLLSQVRTVVLEAQAHQDLPFEKLVEALQPVRDPSYMPLTQAMLVLHNTPAATVELPNLTLRPVMPQRVAAQLDLVLHLTEREEGLSGVLEYNITLFDAGTIRRLLRHFQNLLEGVVSNPAQRIGDLPLLTEEERQQILVEWNATHAEYPHDRCLHHLFEEQARRQSSAIAAVCGELSLTYGALDRRANQLAHYLQTLGVGPNVMVGICMERSLELVVALLGIAKAGGAYVPLDPAYPAERLRYMLEDSQVSVVLTTTTEDRELKIEDSSLAAQGKLSSILYPLSSNRVVDLIADWPTIAQQPETNPDSGVTPADLVYVIYTSGSTGRPKGVLLDHRGRVNNFCDFNRRFAIGGADRLLALSSLSFDMSAYDVFGTLAAGGTIILPEAARTRDPAHWVDLMLRHDVTIWHSAPALLELLVDQVADPTRGLAQSLRLALLGGDWIPVRLPDRLKALVPGVQVISLGGATEASMDSTIYPIEQTDPAWASIPYGRPMTNQRCYILDARWHPLPVGVPGELHLGGVGVAWGYHNNPDLTAAKFIPNPFLRTEDRGLKIEDSSLAAQEKLSSILYPLSSTRLYKTGDLARYYPDGTIELLGRIDYQVKIRGLRVELGEIEAIVKQHPAVREAVVLAREDGPGDKRLVAYLVPRTEDRGLRIEDSSLAAQEKLSSILYPLSSIPSELRAFLKQRLPDYMVPAAFVVLDTFPLSPNGKVDRRSLPVPDRMHAEGVETFVAPRTADQARLAQVWSQVLGVANIGIHDNFFDLGGDSFKAIKVLQKLDGDIALIDVFTHPTICELAERISEGHATDRVILYQLTKPAPNRKSSLVCVPYGGGHAVIYQPLADALGTSCNLYSVALPGHDFNREKEALLSIDEFAPMCVEEINHTVPGPIVLYGHCAGVALTLAIARLLEDAQGELQAIVLGGALPGSPISRTWSFLSKILPRRRAISDAQLLAYLKSLGGFDEITDPAELGFVLRTFGHDGRCAVEYFERVYRDTTPKKLRSPIICIVGDKDPLTKGYRKRFKEWSAFSNDVRLAVVEGGEHYFVKYQAHKVAQIIDNLPALLSDQDATKTSVVQFPFTVKK